MVTRAPREDPAQDAPRVRPPRRAAAGNGAVASIAREVVTKLGVTRGLTLLHANQQDGFDCPGCAWPDPAERHVLEFCENGVTAIAEESWTKKGGMDDRAEVYGSEGVAYADLLHGNAIETYSAAGYDYAVEKAGSTKGWASSAPLDSISAAPPIRTTAPMGARIIQVLIFFCVRAPTRA